jgi:hypothetical protein
MSKQIKRKLNLSKETIAHLTNPEQENIRAGYLSASCPDLGCNTDGNCTASCPSVNWRWCVPSINPDCETQNSYCAAPPCIYW